MHDLTPEPVSNIIAINPAVDAILEIQNKRTEEYSKCPGHHKSIVVDSKTRTVQCQHCGYTIDPFEYLEAWAKTGERRMDELKTIAVKIRVTNAEHEDLLRKVKNLRAQLKRAGHPQPELERREYDRERYNAYNKRLEIPTMEPVTDLSTNR